MRELNSKNLKYAFVSLALAIFANQIVYQGSRVIQMNFLKIWDIALPIDRIFPLVPWTLTIYFGCYLVWCVSYIVIALQEDRKQSELFFAGLMLSKLFCLVIFLAVPTTSDIRPVVTGNSFFENGIRFLYSVDFPDTPTNFFPSIHCLISWSCFIGVRGKKQFPLWWRVASFVLAVAVFVSTITTRQHVILDVFGGIVFAELGHAMVAQYDVLSRTYTRFSSWVMKRLFKWNSIEG